MYVSGKTSVVESAQMAFIAALMAHKKAGKQKIERERVEKVIGGLGAMGLANEKADEAQKEAQEAGEGGEQME